MDVEDPAAEVTPKMIDLLFRPYRIDQPNMIVELAGTFGEKLVQDPAPVCTSIKFQSQSD